MKANLGLVLVVLAGAVVFALATVQTFPTYLLSAVAVLVMAAGALLSGTAEEEGRPV
jgi:type III secretory pathway component EscV